MDSDNKRKYLPGILIMTLIFLGLSIFSVYNMINKNQKDDEEQKPKGSYISLLEENLNHVLHFIFLWSKYLRKMLNSASGALVKHTNKENMFWNSFIPSLYIHWGVQSDYTPYCI